MCDDVVDFPAHPRSEGPLDAAMPAVVLGCARGVPVVLVGDVGWCLVVLLLLLESL